MSRLVNIIIVDTSSVISEGLAAIISKSDMPFQLHRTSNLCDSEKFIIAHKKSVVIISPNLVQNNIKLFNTLKNEYSDTRWIAFVFSFHDPQLIALFDSVVNIYDQPDAIITQIKKILLPGNDAESDKTPEVLSEREVDVLKLMAAGFANKEIADKLNISINTAITHRKNISLKTGIKSVSGLTIYAVVKKLITLDSPY